VQIKRRRNLSAFHAPNLFLPRMPVSTFQPLTCDATQRKCRLFVLHETTHKQSLVRPSPVKLEKSISHLQHCVQGSRSLQISSHIVVEKEELTSSSLFSYHPSAFCHFSTLDRGVVESRFAFISPIDDRIARASNYPPRLLRQRNSSLPTNSLPEELLNVVFAMLKSSQDKLNTEWLTVTHVCRQWRSVAFNSPTL
jgi:hypothetical protein